MVQERNANLRCNRVQLFNHFGANSQRGFLYCARLKCRRKRDQFGSDPDRGQSTDNLHAAIEPNG